MEKGSIAAVLALALLLEGCHLKTSAGLLIAAFPVAMGVVIATSPGPRVMRGPSMVDRLRRAGLVLLDDDDGVTIGRVLRGSDAERRGFKTGDVILGFGQPQRAVDSLEDLATRPAGTEVLVLLTIGRDDRVERISLR